MVEQMFFSSWAGLLRVLLVGPLAYLALVAMLRISGNPDVSAIEN
jgi:hypothetical protein